jgi:hypothetical protein
MGRENLDAATTTRPRLFEDPGTVTAVDSVAAERCLKGLAIGGRSQAMVSGKK